MGKRENRTGVTSKEQGDNMGVLLKQRKLVCGKLSVFENFLSKNKPALNGDVVDSTLLVELETRLENQTILFNEFEQIQDEIEMLTEDEQLANELQERETFQDRYYGLVSISKDILKKYDDSKSEGSGKSVKTKLSNGNSNVNLKPINVPSFSGGLDDWLEFRDTFISLVHTNDAYDDINKYHFLRDALQGDAKSFLETLEFSGNFYKTAWSLLFERYNNIPLLVNNNLKNLTNLPEVRKESSSELRRLLDGMVKCIKSLNSLGVNTDNWDVIVIFLVASKLDFGSKRAWEEKKSKNFPKLEDFKVFLKNRAELLENINANKLVKEEDCKRSFINKTGKYSNKKQSMLNVTQKCEFCSSDSHMIFNCKDFLVLNTYNRFQKAVQLKLCLNCLKPNHLSKNCPRNGCVKCKAKHHSLLHYEKQKGSSSSSDDKNTSGKNKSDVSNLEQQENTEAERSVNLCNDVCANSDCLLSTAVVKVLNADNVYKNCRVLLDNGSQSNLITEKMLKQLGLKTTECNISVAGVNQAVTSIKSKSNVTLSSVHTNYEMTLSCLVVPKIGSMIPSQPLDLSSLEIPKHLKLADPSLAHPGDIDLLIGAEIFYSLLCIGQIKLGENLPIMQKTKLGWILSGSVPLANKSLKASACNLVVTNFDLNKQLEKFWTIEEPPSILPCKMSQEDIFCENLFENTTKRCPGDGKFIVKIPLSDSEDKLGDSKELALGRFHQLEKSFAKSPKKKEMYCNFMKEYEQLGHMSLISDECSENVSYFLPHHGVLNENSLTTRLRVVFNGSALSDSGYSLNDIQHTGPIIQDDLLDILLRFRQYNVIACADIEKMYRMVWIDKDQRCLQKILWRNDVNDEVKQYSLNTVTYGTRSAAYLAIRCLKQLGLENLDKDPDAANVILHSFYVDDMLSGGQNIDEVVSVCKRVDSILKEAGFHLRKWLSNKSDVINKITESNKNISDANEKLVLGEKDTNKTLGLYWSFKRDTLMYSINLCENVGNINKRNILSDVSKIFDPLGLLSPSIILVKILLQKLWDLKVSWDESLPLNLNTYWRNLRNKFFILNDFEIDRQVVCKNTVNIQLHAFCDASAEAFGSCVYVRSIDINGKIHVSLLAAKSKVAPLRTISIPRLELNGAVVLVQLVDKIKNAMTLKFDDMFFWCDSTVVLSWLAISPHLLQTYVANRVAQVQTKTFVENWHHVRSEDNPADILSRGCSPENLINESVWWNGPRWLSRDITSWPVSNFHILSEIPETKSKSNVLLCHVDQTLVIDFSRFSEYWRLINVVAYVLRFINKLFDFTKNKLRYTGHPTFDEKQTALLKTVMLVQKEYFSDDIKCLREKSKNLKSSKLIGLTPFLDPSGILRVGGRLANSDLSYDRKHQILLPAKHQFTKLLLLHEHKRLLHAGPQLLLSSIREQYWIIGGRNLARAIVRSCVKCFRVNPNQGQVHQIMGILPELRVNPKPPFYAVGVDYAGPVMIRNKKGRGFRLEKAYIVVYVCFTTKCVHLDLVTNLTSSAFIACFRRFVSRRGKPHTVFSDNGKTFVGANSELKELGSFLVENNILLTKSFENDNVVWKFIPAYSPNFGGLWEAAVKSCKRHLKRVLGTFTLDFEGLYTLLTQIESVLNSRPIVPMSPDPNDLDILTPGHFLIGKRLTSLPDGDYVDVKTNRLDHYQQIQKMYQQFWQRWSKEYLNELQTRNKWKLEQNNLEVGEMVLIREDNLPPLQWKLGRVTKIVLGPDSKCRVAHVKTQTGEIKRAISKLCVLPSER